MLRIKTTMPISFFICRSPQYTIWQSPQNKPLAKNKAKSLSSSLYAFLILLFLNQIPQIAQGAPSKPSAPKSSSTTNDSPPTSRRSNKSCKGTLNTPTKEAKDTSQNAPSPEMLRVPITYDTQKLGGDAAQLGVYEVLTTTSALASSQQSMAQMIETNIKPSMIDLLIGTTTGEEAHRLILDLSTRFLIEEDLKTLANSPTTAEGGGSSEPAIQHLFEHLKDQRNDLYRLMQKDKQQFSSLAAQAVSGAKSIMTMAQEHLPGGQILKAFSEKLRKPKSIQELALDMEKERDLQIEVAKKTIKLQDIADEMKGRINDELSSLGDDGSPLLDAKTFLDGLIEYKHQLTALSLSPEFQNSPEAQARIDQVFTLLDSLINVARQKINERITIALQKQSTLQAISQLRDELQTAAAQYISASKGAQATRIESMVAKQMGDGVRAMNAQHAAVIARSNQDLKDLTQTLKHAENYRLQNHGLTLTQAENLQELVAQVQSMTLSTLELSQSTARLITQQSNNPNLIGKTNHSTESLPSKK